VQKSENHYHDRVMEILKKGVEEQDIDFIREFAIESGGIDYATQKAEYFTQKALACLEPYEATAFKNALLKLTKFITTREN